MRKIRSHLVGIDNGEAVLFSDFEDDGPMWAGTGPREVRQAVKFSQSYQDVPTVSVSVSMWDMAGDSNGRMDIRAEHVTHDGFDLVFRTWSDTRIARVRATWQSIGELEDEDAWQLY
ncbi:MAG: H-type lectin domain-containing protein [Pseudomonadota bacterium]